MNERAARSSGGKSTKQGILVSCSYALVGLGLALLSTQLLSLGVFNYRYSYHPVFGTIIQPGHTVRSRVEGSGRNKWTYDGVRRPQLPPGGTARPIVALGDSFMEAFQVDDESVCTQLLEKELAARGVKRPVLNLGKSGYSVADYVHKAKAIRRLFNPAWTIVQIRDDDLQADAWQSKVDGYARFERRPDTRALVTAQTDPVPLSSRSWRYRFSWDCRNAVALLGFFDFRFKEFQEWLKREPAWFSAEPAGSLTVRAAANLQMDFPLEEELAKLSEVYDGGVTLLYIAQFDPRRPTEPRGLESTLVEMANRRGWSLVNLRSGYAQLAQNGLAPFGFPNSVYNSGHWNEDGHRLAATLLAEEITHIDSTYGLH